MVKGITSRVRYGFGYGEEHQRYVGAVPMGPGVAKEGKVYVCCEVM